MARIAAVLAVLAGVLLAPSVAFAQASIAGVVKDASGAVMPGVTVDVTSPALIEKIRSGVTDNAGQYQITSLPPGLYAVTFALASFNTVRREGIALTGTFAAKIDADMRVGALEETVTVTGESPMVDVQNATRQTVLGREIIDTIPAGRNPNMLGVLIPGITTNNPIQDVGGAESRGGTQPGNTALAIHGGRSGDQIYMQNGVSAVSFDGAFINPLIPNPGATQEIVLDTAAASVEHYAGGVRINIIPRDGANTFNGTFFATFANSSFQGNNLDDDLKARGVTSGEGIKKLVDFNPGAGGPIRRDKLWFFASVRYNQADSLAANSFYNLNANDPNVWTFTPEPGRQPSNDVRIKDGQVRLTLQATPRNKIGLVLHEQVNCYCPAVLSALNSFETQSYKSLPIERSWAVDWTMPATNRFLIEAGAFYYKGTTNWNPWPGLARGMISVNEQSTGLNYRSGDAAGERRYGSGPMAGLHSRVAASYITGTHAFKVGFNDTSGGQSFSNMVLVPLKYRLNNGVPNRITQYAYGGDNDPLISKSNIDYNMGIFAQDKWTLRRLTATAGLRFDWFKSSFPEQTVTPSLYAPTRNIVFPKQGNLSWKDVTPRMSAIYDLFGNGKTGLKVSLSKYLENMGTSQDMVSGPNPTRTLVTTAFRSWTDQDRDFVADCDLLNPAAQDNRATGGDLCGALSDTSFGSVRPGGTYDPELMGGFGTRGYNWELGAGVQHELLPRVAVDVSYFRRWYGNFRVTDNLAIGPADYDVFSITAPADPRLPGGGGYVLPNVIDLKPAKFGLPAQNLTTLASHYGRQTEYWQGLDLTINARPASGTLLQGGLSAGRTVTDSCEIAEKVPETRVGLYCHNATAWMGGTQLKFLGSYTIPKIDTRLSATYQNIPGAEIAATFNATNAVVAPSLGRPLSGGAANVPVNLIQPGTMYGDRINQVDVRIGKIVGYGRARATLSVDVFNAFNANPVLTQNANFDSWLRPTNILQARFLKLGVQFDF